MKQLFILHYLHLKQEIRNQGEVKKKIQNIHWSINDTAETIILFLCPLLLRHISKIICIFSLSLKSHMPQSSVYVCINIHAVRFQLYLSLLTLNLCKMKISPWMKRRRLLPSRLKSLLIDTFYSSKKTFRREPVCNSLIASNLATNVTQPVKHCLNS